MICDVKRVICILSIAVCLCLLISGHYCNMAIPTDEPTNVYYAKGPPEINIVIVGDNYVGKTSLLKSFVSRLCPANYEGPSLERYFEDITVEGQDFHLILWEPIALDSYDKMREFIYGKAECVIVCYAVNDLESYKRIKSFWWPEILKFCRDVPIIIAALKTDLCSRNLKCITKHEGKELKNALNASSFVECSSLLAVGIKDVFIKAVRAVLKDERCKVT